MTEVESVPMTDLRDNSPAIRSQVNEVRLSCGTPKFDTAIARLIALVRGERGLEGDDMHLPAPAGEVRLLPTKIVNWTGKYLKLGEQIIPPAGGVPGDGVTSISDGWVPDFHDVAYVVPFLSIHPKRDQIYVLPVTGPRDSYVRLVDHVLNGETLKVVETNRLYSVANGATLYFD